MSDLGRNKLVLFFTRGTSLQTWDEVGILEREVMPYRHLRPYLKDITFVTYGHAQDLRYAALLDDIHIFCNKWRLPGRLYRYFIPTLCPILWQEPVLFKSNQVLGADIAIQAAHRFGRKFIARCGYLPSTQIIWRHGMDSVEAQKIRQMEATVFRSADRVVVTTSAMQNIIVERYHVEPENVQIIPNYVDTKRFQPSSNSRQPNLLCYVGRLEEVKNVSALLGAIYGLDVELLIIGGGRLREKLTEKVQEEQLPVRFLGNVPNTTLPAYLNRASLFILPSHLEHHPKALVEAMACGLPVIGTNVFGIQDLIRHRETGYLCGTSAKEIRAAIQNVLSDTGLQALMGRNAREFVVENFALERVVETELALLEELAA